MNNNIAGKVIGAGGFGCVFYPSLKCKNSKNKYNGISKLSLKNEVEKEEKLNNEIKPIILKIKNYDDYFIINKIFSCKPNKLTQDDLEKFDTCISLINLGITKDNINKNLDKFLILNIPYGGEELFNFISNEKDFIKRFIFYNKKFYNILKFAIIKMNKLGLIHNDIKSNNLLINIKDLNEGIKIIDWGMSTILKNRNNIPDVIKYRGIQFNLPFSSIIFDPNFKIIYESVLKTYRKQDNKLVIKNFIIYMFKNYYFNSGHTLYIINYLFPLIYKSNNNIDKFDIEILENNKGFQFIIKYLENILLKYTDFENFKFQEKEYYFNIFSHNCDLWGFLTIYLDILLVFKKHKFNKKPIIELIKNFLYNEKYAISTINKENLLTEMLKIKINNANKTRKKKQ